MKDEGIGVLTYGKWVAGLQSAYLVWWKCYRGEQNPSLFQTSQQKLQPFPRLQLPNSSPYNCEASMLILYKLQDGATLLQTKSSDKTTSSPAGVGSLKDKNHKTVTFKP